MYAHTEERRSIWNRNKTVVSRCGRDKEENKREHIATASNLSFTTVYNCGLKTLFMDKIFYFCVEEV